jgi:hypothetical protein
MWELGQKGNLFYLNLFFTMQSLSFLELWKYPFHILQDWISLNIGETLKY